MYRRKGKMTEKEELIACYKRMLATKGFENFGKENPEICF
jgi:hypothetical protein